MPPVAGQEVTQPSGRVYCRQRPGDRPAQAGPSRERQIEDANVAGGSRLASNDKTRRLHPITSRRAREEEPPHRHPTPAKKPG